MLRLCRTCDISNQRRHRGGCCRKAGGTPRIPSCAHTNWSPSSLRCGACRRGWSSLYTRWEVNHQLMVTLLLSKMQFISFCRVSVVIFKAQSFSYFYKSYQHTKINNVSVLSSLLFFWCSAFRSLPLIEHMDVLKRAYQTVKWCIVWATLNVSKSINWSASSKWKNTNRSLDSYLNLKDLRGQLRP